MSVRRPNWSDGEFESPPTYVFPRASTSNAHGYSIPTPPASIPQTPAPSAASSLSTKVSVLPLGRSVSPSICFFEENGEPISTTESPSACARTPRSPGTSVSQRPAPSDAENFAANPPSVPL